jgi:hypothetical protein
MNFNFWNFLNECFSTTPLHPEGDNYTTGLWFNDLFDISHVFIEDYGLNHYGL